MLIYINMPWKKLFVLLWTIVKYIYNLMFWKDYVVIRDNLNKLLYSKQCTSLTLPQDRKLITEIPTDVSNNKSWFKNYITKHVSVRIVLKFHMAILHLYRTYICFISTKRITEYYVEKTQIILCSSYIRTV